MCHFQSCQQIVYIKETWKEYMGGRRQGGVWEGGSTGGNDMGRRLSDEWVAIFGLLEFFWG